MSCAAAGCRLDPLSLSQSIWNGQSNIVTQLRNNSCFFQANQKITHGLKKGYMYRTDDWRGSSMRTELEALDL